MDKRIEKAIEEWNKEYDYYDISDFAIKELIMRIGESLEINAKTGVKDEKDK